MKRKIVVVITVAAALMLLGGEQLAAQTPAPHARHGTARRAIADHTTAVAALDGVGAAEGWGRVMVRDIVLADGRVRRLMAVHLLGLEAEAAFTVAIDGLVVGELTTDLNGDAKLRLESPSELFPPVPEDLSPADQLIEAVVYDGALAATLEGSFVVRSFGRGGPQDLVWMERIRLEPSSDEDIHGMARVTRDGDDRQSFETLACGLEPARAYEIRVDSVSAGTVTADEVGQAALELTTTGEADPLPAALQPVEELRVVEWFDEAGQQVLVGTFSGVNMVGSGPIRDRQGDGEGAWGDGTREGAGRGEGQGGPHGSGSGDGSGDGDCDGTGAGGRAP